MSDKMLDLSHALQYALLAGQKGIEWVNFDPTSNPAYQRITECLKPTPDEEVLTECANFNTSAEYVSRNDIDRLVREIDVILHGEDGAAPQASLCDLVGPIRALQARYDKLSSLVFNEVLPALKATGVNVSLVDDLRSAISPETPS